MTERDLQIVDFVSKCPCNSATLHKIFFPGKSMRMANKRLFKLFQYGYINRTRDSSWDNYTYFLSKKPTQLIHSDCMARSYLWLLEKGYTIYSYEFQKQYGKVRPDLTADIEKNGKRGIVAVEVELSNNDFNKKIKSYEEQEFFKSMILVSNYNRKSEHVKITNVNIKELP
jgi:hypothetical protein